MKPADTPPAGKTPAPMDPLKAWRDWFVQNERQWSESLTQILKSEPVARTVGQEINASLYRQQMMTQGMAKELQQQIAPVGDVAHPRALRAAVPRPKGSDSSDVLTIHYTSAGPACGQRRHAVRAWHEVHDRQGGVISPGEPISARNLLRFRRSR